MAALAGSSFWPAQQEDIPHQGSPGWAWSHPAECHAAGGQELHDWWLELGFLSPLLNLQPSVFFVLGFSVFSHTEWLRIVHSQGKTLECSEGIIQSVSQLADSEGFPRDKALRDVAPVPTAGWELGACLCLSLVLLKD